MTSVALPPIVLAALLVSLLAWQIEQYVCPMHPEIQSVKVGTCLRCGMALVKRAADPAAPEYAMKIEPQWNGTDGNANLRFTFTTNDGIPVKRFQVVHERELHVFIVSRDLQTFQHLHPSGKPGNSFIVPASFRFPGDYMVFADFVPEGAAPQMLQQVLVRPGAQPRAQRDQWAPSGTDRVVEGVRFSLTVEEPRATTPTLLTITLSDTETGQPLTDLEPYLGAPGHLFFTSSDFLDSSHSHPLEAKGSPIRFLTRFNVPGVHRLWLQVQRRGRVITADWTLDVPGPSE